MGLTAHIVRRYFLGSRTQILRHLEATLPPAAPAAGGELVRRQSKKEPILMPGTPPSPNNREPARVLVLPQLRRMGRRRNDRAASRHRGTD
jgi:hypothetical protein